MPTYLIKSWFFDCLRKNSLGSKNISLLGEREREIVPIGIKKNHGGGLWSLVIYFPVLVKAGCWPGLTGPCNKIEGEKQKHLWQ